MDSSVVRRFLLGSVRTLRASGLFALCCLATLAGCASGPPAAAPSASGAAQTRATIQNTVPHTASDRSGWSTDIYGAMTMLDIDPTRENICAVIAVIGQESAFQVNPTIPGLPAIAWREIDSRAAHAGVPPLVVHTALQLKSSDGRSYGDRIDKARTEKDLSDIYEDFIDSVPMGHSLFADRNPIRTRGPMQVNIEFAERYSSVKPYPYPVKSSIADELFTRRGSVYFGTAHLLAYAAPYDSYLYRFADFNAGQYSSRNAAFQNALSRVSGIAVVSDGALLPHGADAGDPGGTELAARAVAKRLDMSDEAIHRDLQQGRSADFERSPLYRRVFAFAERMQGQPLPRAALPRIQLHGPKIQRRLTTEWYAHRVEQRFNRCLSQVQS